MELCSISQSPAFSIVKYNTSTTKHDIILYDIIKYSAIQQSNTIQCDAMQYDTIYNNTIEHIIMEIKTMQYSIAHRVFV